MFLAVIGSPCTSDTDSTGLQNTICNKTDDNNNNNGVCTCGSGFNADSNGICIGKRL